MTEWFKEWFASEEYLNVYKHRDTGDAKSIISLILKNVSIPNKAKILDAACGAGRHAIALAQKGYKVTAFDLSEPLVNKAKTLSNELNLNINFFNADLRTVDFKERFSLILNLFTSFGYFENDEENFRFLTDSKKWLLPKGYFILDYLNMNYIIENHVPQSVKAMENKKVIENRRFNKGRIEKEIIIHNGSKVETYNESVKLYSFNQIAEAAQNAGLTINKIFGDYKGNEFDEELSERLIIIFKK
ncbi:MAG: class I SAM-dependent methyltransferase [Ignavibacteriae bacterium]|nr:class I SAM-dependent methyltransferase [Ignavibacteriota bacterium]NOG98659.1 class I SAM-dependent methyltransferase [Ignavibacteriota bacterium]